MDPLTTALSTIPEATSKKKRKRSSSDSDKRGPNFTSGEVEKLKTEYERRKSILKAKFSSSITHTVKNNQWKQITAEVNKVGTHNRTYEQIKRKWENIQSEIKNKLADEYSASKRKKTGGGEATGHDPTPEDDRMIAIIGETAIFGIEGGIDSSQVPGKT